MGQLRAFLIIMSIAVFLFILLLSFSFDKIYSNLTKHKEVVLFTKYATYTYTPEIIEMYIPGVIYEHKRSTNVKAIARVTTDCEYGEVTYKSDRTDNNQFLQSSVYQNPSLDNILNNNETTKTAANSLRTSANKLPQSSVIRKLCEEITKQHKPSENARRNSV